MTAPAPSEVKAAEARRAEIASNLAAQIVDECVAAYARIAFRDFDCDLVPRLKARIAAELSRLTAENADVKAIHDDAECRVDRLTAALAAREEEVEFFRPLMPEVAGIIALSSAIDDPHRTLQIHFKTEQKRDAFRAAVPGMMNAAWRALAARPTPADSGEGK